MGSGTHFGGSLPAAGRGARVAPAPSEPASLASRGGDGGGRSATSCRVRERTGTPVPQATLIAESECVHPGQSPSSASIHRGALPPQGLGGAPMAPVYGRGDAHVMHHRMARVLEFLGRVAGPRMPVARAPEALIECRRCRAAFVVPVEWHEHGEMRRWIRLRCGECELVREVEASNAQTARFEPRPRRRTHRHRDRCRARRASAHAGRRHGADRSARARPDRRERLPSLTSRARKMGRVPPGRRAVAATRSTADENPETDRGDWEWESSPGSRSEWPSASRLWPASVSTTSRPATPGRRGLRTQTMGHPNPGLALAVAGLSRRAR